MVYQDRNSGKFRKETIMEQSKEDVTKKLIDNNIEPSIIDDLLGSLTDEDITDLVMRNLDRKLFKGGDKEKNVRDYFEKYIKSLADREEQDPNDDFDVEDEFLYGGEEPEKSKIGRKQFKNELLQVELLKLQEDVKKTGKAIAVVFEGRDSAGKGSTIKRMVEYLDPKYYNIIALGIPTKEERQDWFGRYEKHIEPGKINFFDRSWYNRGIVEPVMGYSSEEEYIDFMENVNDFEQSLIDRGIELVKFWLSITPETQKKRFQMRKASPLKYWKFSPNDEKSIDKWDKYTEYKNKVLKQTKEAKPWTVVDTNDKRAGILNAFRHLLKVVDYEGKEEENVGSVYPEVVTTIKEKEMTEAGNHHWTDWQRVSDVLGRENKILYDFFEKLRLSSVINMLESTHFIYSGSDYLRRYIEFNEYGSDEDFEDLYEAADMAKDAMIRLSIESLERKGKETSLENMNREVKLLARQALQAFIMMK
jgi:polyphosphate kinase 2